MPEEVEANVTVDARGSFCPGPLMELIRAIREGEVGDVIAVLSNDTGSRRDIPLWIEKAGHELIGIFDKEDHARFLVKKLK
ncbi:MAG: sulfurtransferase TusA family protein [Methanomassiliicoccales archaeon]|nr:MAG: sulfurtransferase TusA family protein [Methanomassiliicoccales archaeon]